MGQQKKKGRKEESEGEERRIARENDKMGQREKGGGGRETVSEQVLELRSICVFVRAHQYNYNKRTCTL